jgi:hypothetical protein
VDCNLGDRARHPALGGLRRTLVHSPQSLGEKLRGFGWEPELSRDAAFDRARCSRNHQESMAEGD